MKNSPCYNCNDRKQGCHSECFKYLFWKSENDKEKEFIRKDDDYIAYKCDKMRKRRKR